MQPFEAIRSETRVDAGRFGSFETNWAGTECTATDGDGAHWRFSVKGWAGGQAAAYDPRSNTQIGAYQREKAMSHDGTMSVNDVTYAIGHSGNFNRTFLLVRDGVDVMSLEFKKGYKPGDRVQGTVEEGLDPVAALFFVWLVYVFRNQDALVATAPPALL